MIEAVVEILEPDHPQDSRPSRSQQRTQLFVRLKALISKRKSWEAVEGLLLELEELL